jgi:hypothetical protein
MACPALRFFLHETDIAFLLSLFIIAFLPIASGPSRAGLAPAQLPRVGCYFCLDTKVTKKSSQANRCHHTRPDSRPRALTGLYAHFLIAHNTKMLALPIKSSAKKLRAKTDKTWLACAAVRA